MRTKEQITTQYKLWLDRASDDADLAQELQGIAGNEGEIAERFYTDLVFGTGGMRGVIGAGTNRINIYTVGRATEGLARTLKAQGGNPSVAIAYDSRIKSDLFARRAARILAGSGIRVHLFDKLMPTPTLSYAVRALGCDAGIVVTASHNPAQYNGYKVYDADGCQITPLLADDILRQMEDCPYFGENPLPSFESLKQSGAISYITPDIVTGYIEAVKAQSLRDDRAGRDELSIVYTPLNGAGRDCVLRALDESGFSRVAVVPEQEWPDGNFPTCPVPNPETRDALSLGLKMLASSGADLLVATDPDCDRVGIAVKGDGESVLLNGNEVGVLLFDYICASRTARGTMPDRPVLIKTIVTTEMARPIAEAYGVEVHEVLTGFKFIGEQIGLLDKAGEAGRYIFGFEESYGYLSGSYVRDKDAVNGALLICEMAAHYHALGKSLPEALDALYRRYGTYANHLQSIPFEGRDALADMRRMIIRLRENPPESVEGVRVQRFGDYLRGVSRAADGKQTPLSLPQSDVLRFDMQDNSSIIIRPSGTEPKLKIYYSAAADSKAEAQKRIESYKAYFSALFGTT